MRTGWIATPGCLSIAASILAVAAPLVFGPIAIALGAAAFDERQAGVATVRFVQRALGGVAVAVTLVIFATGIIQCSM